MSKENQGESSWEDLVAGLPEDIRERPALKESRDFEGFVRKSLETESYVGRSIRPPGKDAEPEEYKNFVQKVIEVSDGRLMPGIDPDDPESERLAFMALGKPEEPDAYRVPEFGEDDPKLDDNYVKKLMAKAHDYNLTQKQFQAYVEDSVKDYKDGIEKWSTERETDMKALKEEWGMDTDRRMKVAHEFGLKYADKATRDALEGGYAGSDIYKTWFQQAEMAPPEKAEIASQGGERHSTTMEINEEIAELQDRMGILDKDKTHENRVKQEKIQQRIIALIQKRDKSKAA